MTRKTIQMATEALRGAASSPELSRRYIAGVQSADWQTGASSAQASQNYADGVARAVSEGRFTAGVQAVSNQEWRQAAEAKGGPVIGQRIIGALNKYTQNFGPILSAMNSAAGSLPARTTSPSQNITNRMIPIVRAAVEASGKTFS